MNISKQEFSIFVNEFRFKQLFLSLGWNNESYELHPVQIDTFEIFPKIVAQNNGFKIIECRSLSVPPNPTRIQTAKTIKNIFD
jgi:hypothetical protein